MSHKQTMRQKKRMGAWIASAMAAVMLAGVMLAWWAIERTDTEMRKALLHQTRMVAGGVDSEQIKALSGNETDLEKPEYQHLKTQFAGIKQASPQCRFIYLFGQNTKGVLFYYVDNEPPDSEGYSPPGQTYDEASEEVLRVFNTQTAAVTGPQTDRWGTWVSGLVPIFDPKTGHRIAVLGMDVDARTWRRTALTAAIWPTGLLLAALTMLALSIVLAQSRRQILVHQEALRESEERYRSFISHSIEGIYRNDVIPPVSIKLPETEFIEAINRQAIVAEVNETLAQMYGLMPEDMIGRLATDFAPDFGVRAARILKNDDHRVKNVETCDKDKCGQAIYLMENYHGEVVNEHLIRIWGTQVDITERKREHESLMRTQFAMDRASDSILWVDEDGRLVYVNDSACTSMGYTREELLKLTVFDIDPDFPFAQWEQHKQDMRRLGRMSFESRHRAKDGRTFPVEVSTNYFDFDGHFLSCAFDRDITKRKRAEAALEKRIMALSQPLDDPEGIALEDLFNLEDLQRLQDEFARATGVASLITHPEGTPITKPSNFTRFCSEIIRKTETGLADCLRSDAMVAKSSQEGFTTQLCLGAGLWNSGAIISIGGRHIANWIIGQVRDETQTVEQMSAYARKIGAEEQAFIEAYRDVPVMSQEQFKRVAQVLSTLANQLSASAYQNVQQARFITERKRAEEEREKLTEQLTQSQKMESVGRLAGGVAHDFNNMLGVILGHTELALEQVDPALPLHGSLLEIQKAAERSASLTRQLLAFARKQTVAPKVLDLNDTVEGMLNMLQRLIGEDLDLVWRPGNNLGPVKVDPSQIDQIMANLCVNARDAIGDTGKVMIETDTAVFDESYCVEHPGFLTGEYVLLAVSDDGCGMDKETLDKLFEPFFTTKAMGKGTGLGLATVYGIVKQNNGFINVYSEPGHGSTFKIYLPRYADKASQAPKDDALKSVVRGHETILLVEDEPGILKMTLAMLERQGYTVLAASTPGEAIRLAERYSGEIHLLVTDVVMPEMNGRDLAKNLIALYPNLKRLFMSGYTANVIAHHGVLDEGVHFIQKPFSSKDLAAEVRSALES